MVKKIPIGPYHPILEEPEFFELHVDGEKVIGIDITIGWSHRGIELLSEHKTWDQVPFLVERVCGICSASHPFAYVKAVEDLLQIGGVLTVGAVPSHAEHGVGDFCCAIAG